MNENGHATLGDAVDVAVKRLQYGQTMVLDPACEKCMGCDFDNDGSFTLNDAAHVAMAQFDKATYPWDLDAGSRRLGGAPAQCDFCDRSASEFQGEMRATCGASGADASCEENYVAYARTFCTAHCGAFRDATTSAILPTPTSSHGTTTAG